MPWFSTSTSQATLLDSVLAPTPCRLALTPTQVSSVRADVEKLARDKMDTSALESYTSRVSSLFEQVMCPQGRVQGGVLSAHNIAPCSLMSRWWACAGSGSHRTSACLTSSLLHCLPGSGCIHPWVQHPRLL
jgi:hypothetical protein